VGFFQYLAIGKLDDAIGDLVGEGEAGIAQVGFVEKGSSALITRVLLPFSLIFQKIMI
jgi:hypothetical protein